MTESWRLAAGDHPFKDKMTGALRAFTLINAVIFRLDPDITLLDFRKIQFFLTVASLFILGLALYNTFRVFWFFPLVFSVFLFTGLEPAGTISNLSYYTYPHFFLILHVSFFLLGLAARRLAGKRLFYVLSGVSLWFISLSVLHLSIVILSPGIIWLGIRAAGSNPPDFDKRDVASIILPFLLFWLFFIAYFRVPYLMNVYKSLDLLLSTPNHSTGALLSINPEAMKYIGITFGFLLSVLIILFKIPGRYFQLILISCLAGLMFLIIKTACWGMIRPVYNWFSHPMWLAALIICLMAFFWAHIGGRLIQKKGITFNETILMVIMAPCTLVAVSSSLFSALGSLTVLHACIPIIIAAAIWLLQSRKVRSAPILWQAVLLLVTLAPFYVTTALFDWKFTYFDLVPEQMSVTIEKGFGKGIKTNPVYKNLYGWIGELSQQHTDENDYILSYVLSPMVHMIAKRKPSLEDTFVSLPVVPGKYYAEIIEHMKQEGRLPKLAFMFEAMPALVPVSLSDNRYEWFGKQLWFPSNDPISQYVLQHMELISVFPLTDTNRIRCYRDRSQSGTSK
ncbi:MAG: hypothetical protein ACOZF0_05700 [Thermodesulfobacteriota bacterium]